MNRPRTWSTSDLELLASQIGGKPSPQQIEEVRSALNWCAKVINAADEVVRKEASILGSARRRAAAAIGSSGEREGETK
jgi:hypothetical protein